MEGGAFEQFRERDKNIPGKKSSDEIKVEKRRIRSDKPKKYDKNIPGKKSKDEEEVEKIRKEELEPDSDEKPFQKKTI